MFREIPPKQIEKAKDLLILGNSMRSVEFQTGLSFTKVRNIKMELTGQEEKPKVKPTKFFNENEKCWLTGWPLNKLR